MHLKSDLGNTGQVTTLTTNKRFRNFCYTSFLGPLEHPNIKYKIEGIEICPQSKKEHIQGYLEWKQQITFKAIKKIWPSLHIEERKGTQDQAITYCKKDGKWTEFGTKAEQGKRTDIIDYIEASKTSNELEIMQTYPETWARHERLYQRVREVVLRHTPKFPPYVIVLCGRTGSGKSCIPNLIGEYLGSLYTQTGNYKWWDGYLGETITIFDDYDGQLKEKDLLQILDRYKYKAEIKGGHTYIISPLIFISCSNLLWATDEQVKRRINQIWYPNFKGQYE